MIKIFRNQKHKALFVILTAVVGIYANTLFHDFALDDTLVITHNEFTKKGIHGIPEILENDGFVGFFGHNDQLIAGGRYRPMAQIFFAIEYQFFGQNPFVGHLLNILFYALTCFLMFILLGRIAYAPIGEHKQGHIQYTPTTKYYLTLPFIATVIFAVHPLHTEVVANIKGRDEIFSLLGALAALYFSLKYVENYRRGIARNTPTLIWIFLMFLFGLFSKENALTFLAVIPLTIYLFSAHGGASHTLQNATTEGRMQYAPTRNIIIILGIASILFLWARYNALGFWIGDFKNNEILNNPYLFATPIQRLATVLFTWLIYFKLLFLPYPLTHDYYPFHIPILDFSDFRVWISIAILAYLAYFVIKNFKKNRIVSYGILFFFITFSMASNLILNVGTFMNERFVYAPLLGFAIVAGYFIQKIANANTKKVISATCLLILFHALGFTTINRNRAWKNDLTLFTTDVKISKNSAKVNVSAGGKLTEYAETLPDGFKKQEALNQAHQYLHKGVELHPKNHQAWFLLGNCCREMQRFDEAYIAFTNALLINPNMKETQNNVLYTAQQAKLDG
ncbi:MAG: tetratricopeptide repeat protein, partial [Bacteroidales bacterium]|nr:tetratricopeptide repeat protein [Bacteroidales bacterium]